MCNASPGSPPVTPNLELPCSLPPALHPQTQNATHCKERDHLIKHEASERICPFKTWQTGKFVKFPSAGGRLVVCTAGKSWLAFPLTGPSSQRDSLLGLVPGVASTEYRGSRNVLGVSGRSLLVVCPVRTLLSLPPS